MLTVLVVTVINIGTSAQFTFVMPQDFSPTPSTVDHTSPVEYVPYFAARYLSETASLNGGNALASFVTTLCHWLKELGNSTDQLKLIKLN
jgi:sedoheptulokinase